MVPRNSAFSDQICICPYVHQQVLRGYYIYSVKMKKMRNISMVQQSSIALPVLWLMKFTNVYLVRAPFLVF